MERDLTSSVKPEVAFDLLTITENSSFTGNTIDSIGFESVDFSITSGLLPSGKYQWRLFHGDEANMSDAVEVTASEDLIGKLPLFQTGVNPFSVLHFGYVGKKRFMRLKVVSTGVTSSGTFSSISVLGHAKKRPTD